MVRGRGQKHVFDDDHYGPWNTARIKYLEEHFGKSNFKGKTVLEVGCGHGTVGLALKSWGADVTFSDGRPEHLDTILKGENTVEYDLNKTTEWPFKESTYDIILHFGVLYHLENPEDSIKQMSKRCNTLILESQVLKSSKSEMVFSTETTNWDAGGFATALHGKRHIPSYVIVEEWLGNYGFDFQAIKSSALDKDQKEVKYAWTDDTLGSVNTPRGFWICNKKRKITPPKRRISQPRAK